jgi:hypothetical protein
VREKQVPPVIVELLAKSTRLVQREFRRPHSVELGAPHLAAEKQLERAALQRALFVLAV